MNNINSFNVSESIQIRKPKGERFCNVCRFKDPTGVKEVKLGETIIPMCRACRETLLERLSNDSSEPELRSDAPPIIVEDYEVMRKVDKKWFL